MKKLIVVLLLAFILTMGLATVSAQAYTEACWGQATAAFAQMGEMGEHASQQPTPRLGLANLANALYDLGIIDAPTLQSLAAYLVSVDPDLTVEACMD